MLNDRFVSGRGSGSRSSRIDTYDADLCGALGVDEKMWQQMCQTLGRTPTVAELSVLSVMWSEHCSYKSSKMYLRQFGQKTTPKMQKLQLAGMGQNAGVLDLGRGYALAFKVESHNHPSFIEPFFGAATGVGGIVRDVLSMGARPVAVMDSIHFAAPGGGSDTLRPGDGAQQGNEFINRVVDGIAFYGNCIGLPNIGGETKFDSRYAKNPLVNALAAGVLRHKDLRLTLGAHVGDIVVLFGARTGVDGIGGASVLASDSFSQQKESLNPAIQIGDPFLEKLLLECCMELYSNGYVRAIQDLGAAGISCALAELCTSSDMGMQIDLESVPLRQAGMTPEQILISESQERMMAIVDPADFDRFMSVCDKWDVSASKIGVVTESRRLLVTFGADVVVDLDPKVITEGAGEVCWPVAEPESAAEHGSRDSLLQGQATQCESALAQLQEKIKTDPKHYFCALLEHISCKDATQITLRYDRYVRGNTAFSYPESAGIVRVCEETGLGFALSLDSNAKWAVLDPYRAVQHTLLEGCLNLACTGAEPLGVSNCLNFGSPQNPEVMWQFAQTVQGLADACLRLEIPVTGGNVSFYNQTDDEPILPTPVIATAGKIDNVEIRVPSAWQDEGCVLYLLGASAKEDLNFALIAEVVLQKRFGRLPDVDFDGHVTLVDLLQRLCAAGVLASCADLSTGGLALALCQGSARGVGARVVLDSVCERDGLEAAEVLFCETPGRVLASVPHDDCVRFEAMCAAAGVPFARVGVTCSDELDITGIIKFDINTLKFMLELKVKPELEFGNRTPAS